MISYYRICM